MYTISEPAIFEASVQFTILPTKNVQKLKPTDTTPSVKNIEFVTANNTASITVVNFLYGAPGQRLHILGDGFTTIANNTKIFTNTAANKLLVINTVYNYTFLNSVWVEDSDAPQTAAAANTLTGTTLAANVVNSSLTSVGTLISLGVTGTVTAGAFSGPLTGNVTGTILTAAQGNITSVGTLTGLTVTGTIVGSITGNAATATNSTQLGGLSKSQLWNNSGQTHGTYTSFSSVPDFGNWFVHQDAGVTDGPGGLFQYYVSNYGLGNEHAYGSYGLQTAIQRNVNSYLWTRFKEASIWGAWLKTYAGYADTAGAVTLASGPRFLDIGSVSFAGLRSGTTTSGGLQITDSAGTLKGYVYWDASGFGFLNNTGNWAVTCNIGAGMGGTLTGAWTVTGLITGNISGNAGTVTNGVTTGGGQVFTSGPYTSDWFRSNTGGTGWYSTPYAVGVYATQTGRVDLYNGAGLYVPGALTVGGGAAVVKWLTATLTWGPPSLQAATGTAQATVTVTGAVVGDLAVADNPWAQDAGWIYNTVRVSAANTVTYTLTNTHPTIALNPTSRTVRIWVIKF